MACVSFGVFVAVLVSFGALVLELSPRLFAAAFLAGALWCWVVWDLE